MPPPSVLSISIVPGKGGGLISSNIQAPEMQVMRTLRLGGRPTWTAVGQGLECDLPTALSLGVDPGVVSDPPIVG